MRRSPLLVGLALLTALNLHASPLPQLPEYQAVGSGTLRYFGLHLYDATLWSPRGVWSADKPFALELRYARSFGGAAIARRSIEEIRSQRNYPAATLTHWEQRLRALFPDVNTGDRLIGVRMPGQGVAFFSGTRKLGQIEDEAFAVAFFDIWLHPSTRVPDLRARLLGAT
jgi:hypothetical protein